MSGDVSYRFTLARRKSSPERPALVRVLLRQRKCYTTVSRRVAGYSPLSRQQQRLLRSSMLDCLEVRRNAVVHQYAFDGIDNLCLGPRAFFVVAAEHAVERTGPEAWPATLGCRLVHLGVQFLCLVVGKPEVLAHALVLIR